MSRLSAWIRWQNAAGPWRGWAICPALSMPSAVPDSIAPQLGRHAQVDLPHVLSATDTAVVLDLEPSEGVRLAAEANRQSLAHVVLVLPRWPHADAVLPTGELLATLLNTARNVKRITSSNVVFVLDGERQRSVDRPAADARVDNRYPLSVHDLPGLATLRAAGIRRVVKVVQSR